MKVSCAGAVLPAHAVVFVEASAKEDVTMKKLILLVAVVIVGLVTFGVGVASAQDVYKLNYFSNNSAPAPDATVRIDNPGLTYGNVCAMIYVFDSDQQLTECCGCVETHNGLRTLSVSRQPHFQPLDGRSFEKWRNQDRLGGCKQLAVRSFFQREAGSQPSRMGLRISRTPWCGAAGRGLPNYRN